MNPTLALSDDARLHSLQGTHPEARPHFAELLDLARELGMHPYVSSATRTCAEQAGTQSAVGGCNSWHTFGRAIDLELHDPDNPAVWDDPIVYEVLGEAWEEMGGIWGGRFVKSYPQGLPGYPGLTEGDPVHFQWADTGRVPDALCPRDTTDCQAIVDAYLRAAFAAAPAMPPAPVPIRDDWTGPVALALGVAGTVAVTLWS